MPIAILSALVSGYIALQIGHLLAPILMIPNFEVLLAILVAFDVLALVCVVHVKLYRGPSEKHAASLFAVGIMNFAIGLRCARGMGAFAIWTGVVNSFLATVVTFVILRFVKSQPDTGQ